MYWPVLSDSTLLRNRRHYEQDLVNIFAGKVDDIRDITTPGGLARTIVNKTAEHLFPGDMSLVASDPKYNDLLDKIEQDTLVLTKAQAIPIEGGQTGTVALKSVFRDDSKTWALDILTRECIQVEVDPLDPETIKSITIMVGYESTENGSKVYWWQQERWTVDEYIKWPLKQSRMKGQPPSFSVNDAGVVVKPNTYGEIPITIIHHGYDYQSPYGIPLLDETLCALDGAYTALVNGSTVASQFLQTPVIAVLNNESKTPIRIKIGQILGLTSNDEKTPADIKKVDFGETPESVFKQKQLIKAIAYELAGITNPDTEKEMNIGGTTSGVAFRLFNKDLIHTINNLRRSYGSNGIEKHLTKIFRMGKALGLSGYPAEDIGVRLDYPALFQPGPDEKLQELAVLKQSSLPEAEEAARIATLNGIKDQNIIDQIADNLAENKAMMQPGVLPNANTAG